MCRVEVVSGPCLVVYHGAVICVPNHPELFSLTILEAGYQAKPERGRNPVPFAIPEMNIQGGGSVAHPRKIKLPSPSCIGTA